MYLEEVKELYDWIESSLSIKTVGVQPLQPIAGFLFLRNGDEAEARVFRYNLTIFERSNEKYRGISTTLLHTVPLGITNSYEHIKHRLINIHKLLTPPAVYAVESEMRLPFEETLLPIAKRLLVQRLSSII
jgi:hypothetical protein